jgi:hypothetical protein
MALQAVWSFWSKPYLSGREQSWAHDWYHWLAWGLSVHTASQHYPDTRLVTDTAGARVLVDLLGLPFRAVSTALDRLEDADPGWWALGKLEAYRLQERPFVHVDTDVFLWNRLPQELEQADLFAQNPEPIVAGATCYEPEVLERMLGASGDIWLAEEWRWYRQTPGPWRAECCGIFGGRHTEFIHHYASQACRLLEDPANAAALDAMTDKHAHMILSEQYLLTACVEYHRSHPSSRFHGVGLRYLFDDIARVYHDGAAQQAGFTHLASGTKRNARVCRDLEARVRTDLPAYYQRCREVFAA